MYRCLCRCDCDDWIFFHHSRQRNFWIYGTSYGRKLIRYFCLLLESSSFHPSTTTKHTLYFTHFIFSFVTLTQINILHSITSLYRVTSDGSWIWSSTHCIPIKIFSYVNWSPMPPMRVIRNGSYRSRPIPPLRPTTTTTAKTHHPYGSNAIPMKIRSLLKTVVLVWPRMNWLIIWGKLHNPGLATLYRPWAKEHPMSIWLVNLEWDFILRI